MIEVEKFSRSIRATLENAMRLVEEAEWHSHGPSPTGTALAMLAQEEIAKAFILALVRNGSLPWNDPIRRSLSVHECKNVTSLIIQELSLIAGVRGLSSESSRSTALPGDVAIAINIYRHEMIPRIDKRHALHEAAWDGRARSIARGKLDRAKQRSFYVDVAPDGDVASLPAAAAAMAKDELGRAREMLDFVNQVERGLLDGLREFQHFIAVLKEVFADLPGGTRRAPSERFASGIPGVDFVRTTVVVADVSSGAVPIL